MAENYRDDYFPINLKAGLYDLQRKYGGPTQYPEIQRPVTDDVLESGWIYAGFILAFSLIVVLPGLRIVQSISALIRILLGVAILLFIMICNFGQDWESAYIDQTTTAYKAGLPNEINASISVHFGLRSVNITLKGIPRVYTFDNGRVNETINYNERFHWDDEGFVQGRAGFGKYATYVNREFREHQRKGTPFPILNIAEYLTADGEGLRWGRFYRQAGYFTHIMLWTALPLWILTLILFNMVLRYAAYFSMMTGTSMLIGNIMYASLRNANKLEIRFPDAVLVFSWGWCFWLCVATGIVSFLIGVVVFILDVLVPEKLADFFNFDITKDFEEFYSDPTDVTSDRGKKSYRTKTVMIHSISKGESNTNGYAPLAATAAAVVDPNDVEIEQPQQPLQRGFRKRTLLGPMQKSQKILPRQPPPTPPVLRTVDHGNVSYVPLSDAINVGYDDTYDVPPTVEAEDNGEALYVNEQKRLSRA